MAGLGDLIARVGANIDGYVTAMDQVVKKASDTVDATEQRFSAFANVGQSLATVGAGLTAAITLPIVGIGTAATTAFGEFQSAMNRTSALGDIYGQDLTRLRDLAIDLGARTQFSAKQAADGMAELSASGFNANQIMAAMPGVLNLAAAGQISVGQSAEIASNIMAGFSIKAEGVGHAVDVLAKSAASGSLNVSDLGFTMKYVGPVATAAGLSFEEVTAAVTLLSNAGIKGEQAGTGLRGAIASLISPSKKGAAALAELGVTTTDANGKLLPLDQIFQTLKASGASTADVFTIFGRETASTAQKLIDFSGTPMTDMITSLQNSDGAASKMAGTLNQGVNGAFERMKGSIDTAKIALGDVLEPIIISVAGWIEQAANAANSAIQWFGQLPTPVQNVALAAVGLVAAAGPILTIIGGIGMAVPAVTAGFAAISTALGAVTLPMTATVLGIAAITAALIALGTWVADNWEPIKASVLQAWDGLTDLWMASWGPIITNLQTVWTNIGTVASTVWGAIVTFLSNLWAPVGSSVESVWNGISTFLGNVWNGIASTASTVWNGIVSVFQTFLDWAGKIPGVNKLMNLDEAWDHAKKLEKQVKNTTTAVKDHTTAHKDAKPKIEDFGKALHTATGKVSDHTKAVKDHKPHAEKFNKNTLEHIEKLQDLKKKLDTAKAEQELLTIAFKNGEGPVQAMAHALDDVKVSLQNIVPKFDTVQDVIGKTITPANDLTAAFKALNVTSSTDLKTAADNAKTHYDTIKNSGIATKGEIEAAWQAMTKAEIDYRESVGKDAAALETELEKHTGKHRKHRDDVKTIWGDIKAGIDGAIESFGGNLSNIIGGLFTGEFSISKLGDAFKTLGQDIADVFLKTATDAISDFIKGAIADLMGGKGLGGVLDRIKELGTAVKDIFTGSGLGGSTPTPSPGGGNPSPGGGGGIGAGAGSIVGIVSEVVTAISSVIGNFQMAKMETTLNAIEHNTRYSMMYLGERADGGIVSATLKTAELMGTLISYLTNVVTVTLREIREAISTSVAVNIDLGPNSSAKEALLSSIIARVGFFDSRAIDRLTDINFTLHELGSLFGRGIDRVVFAVTTMTTVLAGLLHDLNPSLFERLFGGGSGGVLGGIGSGIAGIVNTVTGIGQAVTGVLGGSREEGTLNAIEHNTRYAMMYLGEHGGGSIMDILFKIQELVWYGPLVSIAASIRDSVDYFIVAALGDLDAIQNSTYWTLQKVDEIRQMMAAPLEAGGVPAAAGAGGISLTFHFNGPVSSREAADELMNQAMEKVRRTFRI